MLDVLDDEVLLDEDVLVVDSGGGKVCGTGAGAGAEEAWPGARSAAAWWWAPASAAERWGAAPSSPGEASWSGSPWASAGETGATIAITTKRTATTSAVRRTHRGRRGRRDMSGVGNATGPTPSRVDVARCYRWCSGQE